MSVHQFPYYPGTGAPTEIGGDRRDRRDGQRRPARRQRRRRVRRGVRSRVPARRSRRSRPTSCSSRPASTRSSTIRSPACASPTPASRRWRSGCARAADRWSGGRVVAVLEGGYDLDGLAGGMTAVLVARSPTPRRPRCPRSRRCRARHARARRDRGHARRPRRRRRADSSAAEGATASMRRGGRPARSRADVVRRALHADAPARRRRHGRDLPRAPGRDGRLREGGRDQAPPPGARRRSAHRRDVPRRGEDRRAAQPPQHRPRLRRRRARRHPVHRDGVHRRRGAQRAVPARHLARPLPAARARGRADPSGRRGHGLLPRQARRRGHDRSRASRSRSSTSTSRRRTCSSRRTASSRSSTSASRARRARRSRDDVLPGKLQLHVARAGGARAASITAATSSRSASCSTRSPSASGCSAAPRRRSSQRLIEGPDRAADVRAPQLPAGARVDRDAHARAAPRGSLPDRVRPRRRPRELPARRAAALGPGAHRALPRHARRSPAGGARRPELISRGGGASAGGDDLDFDSQVFDGYAPSEGAPGPEQAPLWEDVEQPEADVAAALHMELAELRALRTPVPMRPRACTPVRGDAPLTPGEPVEPEDDDDAGPARRTPASACGPPRRGRRRARRRPRPRRAARLRRRRAAPSRSPAPVPKLAAAARRAAAVRPRAFGAAMLARSGTVQAAVAPRRRHSAWPCSLSWRISS